MAAKTVDSNGNIIKPMEGVFKDSPTLTIPTGDRYGMTFGVRKAKAILANLDTIKKFVSKHKE